MGHNGDVHVVDGFCKWILLLLEKKPDVFRGRDFNIMQTSKINENSPKFCQKNTIVWLNVNPEKNAADIWNIKSTVCIVRINFEIDPGLTKLNYLILKLTMGQ